MTLNHIHLQVRDLNAAVVWFETVLQVHPAFRNERMATFSFGSLTLIFDAASDDDSATVGFESDDCDRDFKAVVERGAVVLDAPIDKEWGVRTAYFKGPGNLNSKSRAPSRTVEPGGTQSCMGTDATIDAIALFGNTASF